MRSTVRSFILACGLAVLWALDSMRMARWTEFLLEVLLTAVAMTMMRVADARFDRR